MNCVRLQHTLRLTSKRITFATRKQTARYASTTPSSDASLQLTWPQYLEIRRGKRRWQTAMTIPCAFLGLFGGAAYFGSLDTDPMKPVMGFDPFFFYGACTAACMGVGALIGPTLGSTIWRISHRRYSALIDARDREFFKHIAKNRVDASIQSPTNPVPDYYGEKIGSLHEYRTWLRDQSKYRKKVMFKEDERP